MIKPNTMSYISTLTTEKINNATVLVKRMRLKNITNVFTISAILAVVSKECSFIPHSEASYKNTSNDRIRKVFGKLRNYTDDQLNKLKSNDVDFFNAVYGGKYGNALNEGYKFRGMGYHQLTFEFNYKKVGNEIGVDLEHHPELLNNLDVASDELIQYFVDTFNEGIHLGYAQKYYHATTMNGFTNATDAVNTFYHCNAGWGKSLTDINADVTGGKAMATSRMNDLIDFVNKIPTN